MGECPRGGFCNFMHLKPISQALRRKLYSARSLRRHFYRTPSRSPPIHRDYLPTYSSNFNEDGDYVVTYDDGYSKSQNKSRSRSRSPSRKHKKSNRH